MFSFSLFANESINTKVKKLTLELRCMTCQNQSVHDSDSDYSKDIKIFVKKKFEEGLNLTFDWYLKNIKYFSSLNKKDITKRLGLK